jgi:hypothetical protein
MFRPHVILVTGKFGLSDIGAGGAQVNHRPQKGETFPPSRELLAFSCPERRACDEKTTLAGTFRIAPILPFMHRITPGPDCRRGEPRPMSQRPIGHHLKISECEFRIVNQSFTPAWKCWTREEIEKCNYVCP